jgi:chromosome segregation ATPase
MSSGDDRGQLRRALVRGVRREDVDRALEVLEQRNEELARELEQARGRQDSLVGELEASQDALGGYQSALKHAGSLLALAQERARQIEEEAQARAHAVAREIESLQATKDEAVASLERLRLRLNAAVANAA